MLLRTAAVALALLLPALASAQSLAEQTAVRYLQTNWNRHNLESADVADLVVTDQVPGPNGIEVVYLRQAIGGVEVASGPLTVAIDKHGRVFHATGRLTRGALQKASGAASLSPEAAVRALAVASDVVPTSPFEAVSQKSGASRETVLSDGGVTRLPVRARLVYAEIDGGLRLAWETTLFLKTGGDWFGHIDAATGQVLRRIDLLVRETYPTPEAASGAPVAPHSSHGHAHRTAPEALVPWAARTAQALASGAPSYRVFPAPLESPLYLTGSGDQRTMIATNGDPTASPFGWHDTDGVAGAEFTITRGNNTHAYLDRDDDEAPDAGGEPDGGVDLTFDFPLDFSLDPSQYTDASVVNLFYWSNIIHDVMYQYGFDEASGNFQANNYGNGGVGGDAVDSESQSGADICNELFPCDTNANFSTPPDGAEPRMQMYIGSNPTPTIDGVFDHTVVAHEYGHGISIRLTGGPSTTTCLTSPFFEHMGEGWSDYFGLLMTIEPGDAGADRRPVGNYLLGQPQSGGGIRSAPYQGAEGAPYSTDFTINPVTYGDTNSSGLSAPHGIGYVWAEILWEMTWELIDAYGWDPDLYNADGTAGNQIALNLVMTGLKLQPCGPGFVDGRDAILAADQALYGGANTELLWEAFARRGLGFGADQGTSTSRSDQTESFVVPESIAPAPVTDLAAIPNGDFVTLAFTATGDDGIDGTASEYVVRTSPSPILDEDDWAAATPVSSVSTPLPSGSAQEVEVTGLDFNTAYHFAVKAVDDSFNASDVSNSAETTTLGPPEASVPTDTVVFDVLIGETGSAELPIGNVGEGDLRYSITLADAPDGRAARAAAHASGAAARLAAMPTATERTPAKGAPEASGAPMMRDAGGPDAFGYRWIDSNEPGGPTYEWVDISATGTELSLSDDDTEQVDLPFAFPFYGVDRTSVRVVSNGFLKFGTSSTDFSNDPIPSTGEPNDAIYPYWDDLDPANSGSPARIVHQDMGDGRFIVSWIEVPHYAPASQGGEDGSFTFQAILYSNGSIRFQYEDLDFGSSSEGSATIGIEDASGTDGLQVVHNQPYAEEGLAIQFSAFWGDALTLSGQVAGGSTETVTLTADAAGLSIGTYQGALTLATNDPDAETITVPLQLVVSDPNAPLAIVDRTTVVADVPRGATVEETITLTNSGGSELSWILREENEMLPDWLSASDRDGVLAPGASAEITLAYEPGVAYAPLTTETATLEVRSNDPRGNVIIEVTMNVLPGVANEGELDFDGPFVLGEVSPNPVGRSATAMFAVRESQSVTAEVLDLLGRRVALVHEGPVAAMTRQEVAIDASRLASGAYVLVLRGETFTASRRITIAR